MSDDEDGCVRRDRARDATPLPQTLPSSCCSPTTATRTSSRPSRHRTSSAARSTHRTGASPRDARETQVFPDSEDLDACPMLRGRERGRCSGVCVPVSIMGRTVGVVHATGPVGEPLDDDAVAALQTLANQAGNRVGMLRVMAETQLQASTDGLTGLVNRRSLENRMRQLRAEGTDFAVVMADLDHFKMLNDTHGHEAGDRALRIFSETLRHELRSRRHGMSLRRRGVRARAARRGPLRGRRSDRAHPRERSPRSPGAGTRRPSPRASVSRTRSDADGHRGPRATRRPSVVPWPRPPAATASASTATPHPVAGGLSALA